MPAVLAVLVLAVGAILLATHRVALTSAAAEIARLEARGDGASARARLSELHAGPEISRERAGPLHCVTLSARPGSALLANVEIAARGCAAVVDGADAPGSP